MTTGQFMSRTIGCDVEVRQLQRLRVIDVYEQREGALLRYLEALLARSDVDLSVAVERDARRGITIAAQLMRLRSHGALLRPFVEDCLRGASDGYSVNAFAADLLKLLVWIRGAGRPQFLLERFGYMPGSGSIIEPDCRHPVVSIAVRYLRQPAAPDDLLKSIEAISGQARDDLEVLSDHLSWLGPASDLIAQNLQFVVQTVADARVLAPRTHEFWTFSRQQLMKRVVNNPTLVKMALANQAGPLLLVVLADAVGEPSLVQQACYLLNGKDVVVSIDNKRAILNAVLALESHWSLSTHMERIVRHIVDVSENSAMFIGICRQIPFADISNIVEFPFDVAGRELAANLAVAGLRRTLAEMGYSDMERGDIENALGRLNTGGLLQMLIRLHQVHRSQGYEHGMLLIKDMLWRLTQKQYDGYRYRHSAGATQLAFIHGGEFVWRENERLVRYCGDVKGLKPYIKTLRRVARQLSAEVSGLWPGEDWSLAVVQKRFEQCVLRLRTAESRPAPVLIAEKVRLETIYRLVATIERLHRLTIDDVLIIDDAIEETRTRCKEWPTIVELFDQVVAILASTREQRRTVSRIVVEETDDVVELLNLGMDPVRTCQRWDERTTFNVALLSYVLDANKKLIQVKAGGRPVARVVIRLVPMTVNGKMVPTIVVERPYYTLWSHSLAAGVLDLVFRKAEALAAASGIKCAVAVGTKECGPWTGHLRRLTGRRSTKRHVTAAAVLPTSMNSYEYSDTLAPRQLLEACSQVATDLHAVTIIPRRPAA